MSRAIVERLELVQFRNYVNAVFELTTGVTVVVGDNGQGKTNFAEGLAYLATQLAAVSPGGLFVVEGAVAEAAVEEADQSVAECAKGSWVGVVGA